jgi:hypothetical protein
VKGCRCRCRCRSRPWTAALRRRSGGDDLRGGRQPTPGRAAGTQPPRGPVLSPAGRQRRSPSGAGHDRTWPASPRSTEMTRPLAPLQSRCGHATPATAGWAAIPAGTFTGTPGCYLSTSTSRHRARHMMRWPRCAQNRRIWLSCIAIRWAGQTVRIRRSGR